MSTSVNAETDCAFQLRRPTASTYIDRIEAATEKRSMHSSAARICCTLAARYAANAVFQRNSQRAKSNKRLDRRMASTICRYRSEQRTDHIVGRSSKRLDSWLSRCESSGVVSRRKKTTADEHVPAFRWGWRIGKSEESSSLRGSNCRACFQGKYLRCLLYL
jgi:hypothetical protein